MVGWIRKIQGRKDQEDLWQDRLERFIVGRIRKINKNGLGRFFVGWNRKIHCRMDQKDSWQDGLERFMIGRIRKNHRSTYQKDL